MRHLLPTATSADERGRSAKAAILPIGSFEQHGDYLPLMTDTIVASAICAELSSSYPLLHLPPMTISCSQEHSAWPGTVSISSRTLTAVIEDVACSLTCSEIPALVLVNGHGGNYVIGNIVQEANARGTRMALFPSGEDWKEARAAAGLQTTMHEDMHAGELETSLLMHTWPEMVRDGYESADWLCNDRRHLLTRGMAPYTSSGVIGRPSLGSADKGKAILASLVQSFADVLSALAAHPD